VAIWGSIRQRRLFSTGSEARIKGKPAEEAGILPGDKIIKVGNVDLIKAGKDLQETLKRNTEAVVDLTGPPEQQGIDGAG
jgi:C-terminal processing protease CtpA/Prc